MTRARKPKPCTHALLALWLLSLGAVRLHAQTPPGSTAPAHAPGAAASGTGGATPAAEPEPALPAEHEPQLQLTIDPRTHVRTGELVRLQITAEVPLGDDVTIADQAFAPFEVHQKQARVQPPEQGRQRFVFDLTLLALEPGTAPIPSVQLRVVTKDGFVGSTQTKPVPYEVRSWLGNEPNAQAKPETKPVAVLQDNYVPLYIGAALLGILLIAGLTLLIARYLQKRKLRAQPPPPPRPPWEIAVEQLASLRRRKQQMLADGQGAVFVDQVSDVVREYLGGRFGFDGLETTTDEMIAQLRKREAGVGFTQEVWQFLSRCDLVKFAKAMPDQDEADLVFGKAQELVDAGGVGDNAAAPAHAAAAAPPGERAS